MGRRTERHEWADHPELLTSLRTPWDKFRKADWNFSRYEDEVFKRPCHFENVSFAALDLCVSLTALRDWTKKALTKDFRAGRPKLPLGLSNLDELQQFLREQSRGYLPSRRSLTPQSTPSIAIMAGRMELLCWPRLYLPISRRRKIVARTDLRFLASCTGIAT